jgi:hypothetical protein
MDIIIENYIDKIQLDNMESDKIEFDKLKEQYEELENDISLIYKKLYKYEKEKKILKQKMKVNYKELYYEEIEKYEEQYYKPSEADISLINFKYGTDFNAYSEDKRKYNGANKSINTKK